MRLLMIALVVLWSLPSAAQNSDAAQRGRQAIADEKYQVALAAFDEALNVFPLSAGERAYAHYGRGYALRSLGRNQEAWLAYTQALGLSPFSTSILTDRLNLSWRLERWVETARDLAALARIDPEQVAETSIQFIWQLHRRLRDAERQDMIIEMQSALFLANYDGGEVGYTADSLYLDLLLRASKRFSTEDQLTIARKLQRAHVLMQLHVDRRVESLWGNEEFQNLTAPHNILERELAWSEAAMAAQPENLTVVMTRVSALRAAGRAEEALAMGLPIWQSRNLNEVYERDGDLWLGNELAYAYFDLGKIDEGLALLRELADTPLDQRRGAVSQAINHGASLFRYGRYQEAWDQVATIDREYTSVFGSRWIDGYQVCAGQALDKSDEVNAIADDMLKHADENYAATTMALLCLERLDDVAALVIKRLRDPDLVGDMLMALQDIRPSPHEPQAFSALVERFRALLQRQDVADAINEVGRVVSWPVTSAYWGEF